MANQIVISSGAKVRNLNGVLTGTTGVVNSLGINVANGIPQLDGSGKILVSQLPNSVMEYKGTWNAATNTPTLVNGTGNQGDVYLCNVAGTVNFGAGAITFAVGDQAIYSGTIWQKAGGSTGTVTSVAVTETGDALTITGSPITTSGTINIGFAGISSQYVNGAGGLTTFPTLISSIGLSMPSAFTVTNSPLTANGTIAVTGAGVASQYVRGDGTLANFPTSGGGGGSVSYYFNSSVSQGTLGGVAYRELNKVPVIGAGTDITIATNGYIANYITDVGDPALLEIPGGNWNFEVYFSASSAGGTPSFYVELYKYDGTTFTLISSSSATPEGITGGTAIDLYTTALAVPTTALTLTDRLAVRVYVNNSGRTITLHTENSHLCQVITTFSTGITALNGLTAQVQYFGTGTSGTDFNISSATATHTFNLPVASAINTGKLSSTDWSTFNNKLSTSTAAATYVPYTGATTNVDLGAYNLTSTNLISKQLTINTTSNYGGSVILESGSLGVTGSATNGITLAANSNTVFRITSVIGGSQFRFAQFNLASLGNGQTRTYTLPDADGTVALTSNLSGYIQGSGTTNYVPKFTASGTIGNSLIYDTGSRIAIGGTSATYGVLTVQSDSGQFCIQSNTTPGKQLQIGYDHTTNNSYLSSLNQGVAFTPLALQPNGGNVGVGTTTPTKLLSIGTSAGSPTNGFNILYGADEVASFTSNAGTGEVRIGATNAIGTFFTTFYSNNAERMRITSGGNVGIGTSSPTDYSGFTTLHLNGKSGNQGGLLRLTAFNDSSSVNIYASDGIKFNTTSAVPYIFLTQDSERMRIKSDGTVGISISSPNATLHIAAALGGFGRLTQMSAGNANEEAKNLISSKSAGGSDQWWSWGVTVPNEFYIVNGPGGSGGTGVKVTSGSTSWTSASDIRLKDIIEPIDNAILKLSTLSAIIYKFKNDETSQRRIGLVAQEVNNVFSEVVDVPKDENAMWGVRYTELVPVLVKAIQELEARIKQLENK